MDTIHAQGLLSKRLFRHLRGNGDTKEAPPLPRNRRAAVSRTLNFERKRDRTLAMATPFSHPIPTDRFRLTGFRRQGGGGGGGGLRCVSPRTAGGPPRRVHIAPGWAHMGRYADTVDALVVGTSHGLRQHHPRHGLTATRT